MFRPSESEHESEHTSGFTREYFSPLNSIDLPPKLQNYKIVLNHLNQDVHFSISRNWQYKDVYRKIMNDQHHACILEANYYLSVYNVHFKLALSSSRSSGRLSGRGGGETWNLCSRLWQPSFLWHIFTGSGRGAWPPQPPWIHYCYLRGIKTLFSLIQFCNYRPQMKFGAR